MTDDDPSPLKENKESDVEQVERMNRTIFVGNVPVNTKRAKLASFFKQCGPKNAVLSGELLSERDSMNAYVVFQSADAVTKALSLNGTVFQNKHLKVDRAQTPRQSQDRSVFVGNLPFDVEEEELFEAFSAFGAIEYVRVVRDKKTGLGKGFGYVCFIETVSVIAATRTNGSLSIRNRKVRIFRCSKFPKSASSENSKTPTVKQPNKKRRQRKRKKQGTKHETRKTKLQKKIQKRKRKEKRDAKKREKKMKV
eukprot:jgi/Galph1/5788/GphlegSOOS_G4498.1